MASEYTTNFNLDLYTDTDKPNLRDQYNGAMHKIDSQLNTLSNNIVISTEAADQAKEQAKAASDAASANAKSISALQTTVSSIDTAYKAADTKISSDITAAYKAADTKLSNDITAAYKTADTKLSNDITAAYKAADSTLAAHFPIRSDDIAAGAITRDKLDAQALSSLIKGITIRHFNSDDSTADNAGLIVPSNSGCHLAGFYLPELTMLVITRFESPVGQQITQYMVAGTKEFKLPDYVPNTTAGYVLLNSVGVCYNSSSDFVTFTGIGMNKDGYLGVSTQIYTSDNKALSMAGNAVVFLRAYGAA